jgi:hypothetical protein
MASQATSVTSIEVIKAGRKGIWSQGDALIRRRRGPNSGPTARCVSDPGADRGAGDCRQYELCGEQS